MVVKLDKPQKKLCGRIAKKKIGSDNLLRDIMVKVNIFRFFRGHSRVVHNQVLNFLGVNEIEDGKEESV